VNHRQSQIENNNEIADDELFDTTRTQLPEPIPYDGYLLPEGSGNTTLVPCKIMWGAPCSITLLVRSMQSIRKIFEKYISYGVLLELANYRIYNF
jgi:hypothetical protein